MRGHGESEKPEHGYRIARLAKDLHDALVALELHAVSLAGHSMGCTVIWSYWDQFGDDRLSRLILIDQPATPLRWPNWSETDWANAGSRLDATSLMNFIAQLTGPEGIQVSKDYIASSFFTPAVSAALIDWVINENLKFPPSGGPLAGGPLCPRLARCSAAYHGADTDRGRRSQSVQSAIAALDRHANSGRPSGDVCCRGRRQPLHVAGES